MRARLRVCPSVTFAVVLLSVAILKAHNTAARRPGSFQRHNAGTATGCGLPARTRLAKTVEAEQVVIAACFDNSPIPEDEDPVRLRNSGKPMCNDESRPSGADRVECTLDACLGLIVKGAGCLIEYQDRGVLQYSTRNADALPFSTGKRGAALADHIIITARLAMMRSCASAMRAAASTPSPVASSRPI